jgi:hypothetical protein
MRYLKRPKLNMDFDILYDKQEKQPWLFLNAKYGAMERVHLKTGDYTIKGFEDVIAIEKKSGIMELLNDLSGNYRPTFQRFLMQLSKYPVKAIVVESPLRVGEVSKAIATRKRKSNGKAQLTAETIWYWTAEITMKYRIPLLFVDSSCLVNVVCQLFESAYRNAQEI